MASIGSALDVVGKGIPTIFPIVRIIKVIRYGSKVTNSTNPCRKS